MSSFLSLLKSIGPIIAEIIMSAIPAAAPFAPAVPVLVGAIETELGSGTGPVKRAALVTAVTTVVSDVNIAKGTTAVDPATVGALAGTVADTTVGIINIIQAAKAAVPPAVVPVAAPAPAPAAA